MVRSLIIPTTGAFDPVEFYVLLAQDQTRHVPKSVGNQPYLRVRRFSLERR